MTVSNSSVRINSDAPPRTENWFKYLVISNDHRQQNLVIPHNGPHETCNLEEWGHPDDCASPLTSIAGEKLMDLLTGYDRPLPNTIGVNKLDELRNSQ